LLTFLEDWEFADSVDELPRKWRFEHPQGREPAGYDFLMRRIYPTRATRAALVFTHDWRNAWWLHIWPKQEGRDADHYGTARDRARELWDDRQARVETMTIAGAIERASGRE
jgi:hypothetical protein